MTKKVLLVFHNTSIIKAAQILIDTKVGALPVIKDKKLVGIISYFDVLTACLDFIESKK